MRSRLVPIMETMSVCLQCCSMKWSVPQSTVGRRTAACCKALSGLPWRRVQFLMSTSVSQAMIIYLCALTFLVCLEQQKAFHQLWNWDSLWRINTFLSARKNYSHPAPLGQFLACVPSLIKESIPNLILQIQIELWLLQENLSTKPPVSV